MSDLYGHDERREVPRSGGSNTGPYLRSIPTGIASGVLVRASMFPALVLVAISKLQEQRRRSVPPRPDGERELLAVDSRGGSLFYSLPARDTAMLEGRE